MGSGGTSSGSSGCTSRGVISTISSVRSVRSDLLLKRVADDRQAAQDRDFRGGLLRQVVEQPGNHERLAVAQFDIGFGAPSGERGNSKPRERDAVAEIERAHLGPHLQADDVARDRRREGQPNPELLVLTTVTVPLAP